MDKQSILNLENYIFEHKRKPSVAAHMMADIMGVIIDVKPCAFCDFSFDEMKNIDPDEILTLLDSLGLKALFFKKSYYFKGEIEWRMNFFCSKDISTANEMHKKFEELWANLDDFGQTIDEAKRISMHREIGRLLGYPETAVEVFINETDLDIDKPERVERMARNNYYAHSAEHEEEEFQVYDLKLNQTLEEYAPQTAAVFKQKTGKRWLD